ncbi:probable carboxylesterase 8 [Aristolochia californica]|uniref:probable carboxylesterase 8 n=1 Tax=Aristolochia californica TaxID=171875 RepID=UPI0035D85B87
MEEYGSGKKSCPMDPYKFLGITRSADGQLTRKTVLPVVPAGGNDNQRCISKDVLLNKTHGTWFRMYRPRDAAIGAKIPVIIYFHGGGFVRFSAASAPFDASNRQIARAVPAIVLSVDYRLAPEHPLPAAYEDAVEVVKWVRDNHADDEWLRDLADVSRCFIHGSSAGGNIAYHAALECCSHSDDLRQVNIAGVILDQPYFGGVERTDSELRLTDDKIVPLFVADRTWELALPPGADRDHEYCNPLKAGAEGRVRRLPRCLVRGHSGDPLLERQQELVKKLQKCGVHVVTHFRDGFHAIEAFKPHYARLLVIDVKNFVLGNHSNL